MRKDFIHIFQHWLMDEFQVSGFMSRAASQWNSLSPVIVFGNLWGSPWVLSSPDSSVFRLMNIVPNCFFSSYSFFFWTKLSIYRYVCISLKLQYFLLIAFSLLLIGIAGYFACELYETITVSYLHTSNERHPKAITSETLFGLYNVEKTKLKRIKNRY